MSDLYTQLSANLPAEFELMYPNPTARRGKDGPIRRLSFEVRQDVFDAFMDLPGNMILRVVAYPVDDDGQPFVTQPPAHAFREFIASQQPSDPEIDAVVSAGKAQKHKQPKGPHGQFWRVMFRDGFTNHPAIAVWIQASRVAVGSTDREVMRHALNTPSLTFVSPDALRQAIGQLPDVTGALALISQAEKQAANKTNGVPGNGHATP